MNGTPSSPQDFRRQDAGARTAPSSVRAGVGGVGGGTGLVALAQSIGANTTVGALLLYVAPAVSIVVGAGLYYLEVQANRYLERRLVNNARKTLVQQLSSPHTSDEHKARIRRMLEDLEHTIATAELERVKIGIPLKQHD
jgi:hypothetical protein